MLHHGTVVEQIDEGYDPKVHRTVTPVGRQRDLTNGEKTLAGEQGLDTIELSRVVIEHAPESLVNEDIDFAEEPMVSWYVNPVHPYTIFVPEHIEDLNDDVHFTEDFTTETGIERQSIFIHELVHLHQDHDPNWRYDVNGESFEQVGMEAYGYRSRAGTLEHDDFLEYSEEEQAAILEDRFRLKNGVNPRYDCVNPPRVNWPCNTPRATSIETMYGQLDNLKNIPED